MNVIAGGGGNSGKNWAPYTPVKKATSCAGTFVPTYRISPIGVGNPASCTKLGIKAMIVRRLKATSNAQSYR